MKGRHIGLMSLVVAVGLAVVLAVAGCGSGGNTSSTSTSQASTTSGGGGGAGKAGGGGSGRPGGGGGGVQNPLAGISPPAGSKKLDSRSSGGVVYEHYSTSKSPSQVQSTYKQELTHADWSIVNTGGSGGGWGPYGGSNYGLTAKKSDDYIDLQAGGQQGQTTYFELCATTGNGSRDDCNRLSNQDQQQSHTHSGGSQGGSKNNSTRSGGS